MLPEFVVDALARSAEGKGREDLLWPSQTGSYLAPPRARLVALRRGRPLPEGGPDVPPGHGPRTAPHRGLAGHLCGRQPQGGAADAGACQRGDDAGRLCRFVRVRSGRSSCDCVQIVATAGKLAHLFDPDSASSSGYVEHSLKVPIMYRLSGVVSAAPRLAASAVSNALGVSSSSGLMVRCSVASFISDQAIAVS